MNQTTIKISYKFDYLQWVLLAFMCLTVCIILPILIFNIDDEPMHVKIICLSMFTTVIIICLVMVFVSYQVAELSSEGILIRNKVYMIKMIKWEELRAVSIRNQLVDVNITGFKLFRNYFVLYTNLEQFRMYGAKNKRKKGPWYISYNENNKKVLKEYVEKYNPGIEADYEII